MRKLILGGSLALVLGGVAAWAMPGPQHALLPGVNGLEEIAPQTWTDAPDRAEEFRLVLAEAEARVADFFGEAPPRPRLILCAADACADRIMGENRPSGRTYGYQLVVFGPEGLNTTIIAHELAHVSLHRHMGVSDLWDQRFPTWFDEGLASWVSRDDRLTPPDAAARARLLDARRFSDWGGVMRDLGWQAGYGAAMALVEEMVAAGGPEGLRGLIARVAAGADFDLERAALLAARAPR